MPTLYDVLTGSESVRDVSLLWIRKTILKESVRLGGRGATLIYEGTVLDISKSFVGPISKAIEFSIFQNSWDGLESELSEDGGTLSGLHVSRFSPDPERPPKDMADYSPNALYSMELVRIVSGDATIWDLEGRINPAIARGSGPRIAGGSPSGNDKLLLRA